MVACSPAAPVPPAPPGAAVPTTLPAAAARATPLQPCPRISLAQLDTALRDGVAGREGLLRGHVSRCARDGMQQWLRFAAYQQALARLPATAGLEARIAAIHRLRARLFDPSARSALFAEEEAYERYLLACAAVRKAPALDAAARREAQLALQFLLPESVRAARSAAMAPVEWLRAETALRAEVVPDAVLEAARSARFGVAAARRLAQVDEERAAWQGRVARYRQARQFILAQAADDTIRAERLQRLRGQWFTPREALRLEAYAAED